MSQLETDIVHAIMMDVSKCGARVLKNVRGHFYTLDSVRALIAAVKTAKVAAIHNAIRNLRQVSAGVMAAGAHDLIGIRPTVITQDMVGQTFGRFVAIEVKTATGMPSDEQLQFRDFVIKNGGLSGVARSPQDARRILNYTLDE